MSAFDEMASGYDRAFSDMLLGRRLRETVWLQLEDVFRDGEHVLDLGCGTGEDAVWLAQRGVRVHAVDASAAMITVARKKAAMHGVSERIRFARGDLATFAEAGVPNREALYDGGLSNFGAINALPAYRDLARELATRIVPGGQLALVVMGPLCPWEWLWFGSRGRLRTACRRLRKATVARLDDGTELRVQYPSPRRLQRELRPYFRVRRTVGIGITLPPTFAGQWAERHPALIDRLTRVDRRISSLFPATWMNDHYLMLFERADITLAAGPAVRDRKERVQPASRARRRTFARRRRSPPLLDARTAYDLWAPAYTADMNPLQRLEADLVMRLLPQVAGKIVLDLGCGKGRISALAQRRGARMTVGTDLSSAMLCAARERDTRAPSHWAQGHAVALPFRGESIDVVCCTLMLGHVADLESALAEIARVLRPGGSLMVSGFHPDAAARGWQRTFVDPGGGGTFAIEHYPHSFATYKRCLGTTRMAIDTFEERRYEGVPLVFLLRAQKSRDRSQPELRA